MLKRIIKKLSVKLGLLPKNDKNTIDVEKVVFFFGCLSRCDAYRKNFTLLYRTAALLILVLNAIRWITLLFIPVDSIWTVYLGDIALFMAGPRHRQQFLWVMTAGVVTTLHSINFVYQELNFKNTWLSILKSCADPNFNFGKIGLFGRHKNSFRQRVWLSTKLSILCLIILAFMAAAWSGYICYVHFPKNYKYKLFWGTIHTFELTLTFEVLSGIALGMAFVFNQITFYFVCRFNHLHSRLKALQFKSDRLVSAFLLPLLKQLDSTYKLIHEYNKFWRIFIGLDYVILMLSCAFLIYLGFFSDLTVILQFISAMASVMIFVLLSVLSVSAASVSKKARKSYVVLNSLVQKRLPPRPKFQLLFAIQRMSAKKKDSFRLLVLISSPLLIPNIFM